MSQLVTDLLSRSVAGIAGLVIVGAAVISLMRTIVIPRALRSIISDNVARAVTGTFLVLSRMRRTYRRRDSVLAWAGPTTIIMQLVTWLVLFLVGYGLLIYGVSGQGLGEAMRQSGSSLFTLGFASIDSENQTIIDFLAAATGPIVIAMLIGFLPTIYSAYLDRELDVTLLSVNGGEPAWGPEVLSRHSMAHNIEGLDETYRDWSKWAARLRLTHVTYPVLVWVRSARANRHYVTSLLAVLDAAALQLCLNRSLPRREAYSLLLQGGQALDVLYVYFVARRPWRESLPFTGRLSDGLAPVQVSDHPMPDWDRHMIATELAASMDAVQGFDRDAIVALSKGQQQPITLARADFDHAVDVLRRSNFPVEVDPDTAWEEFRLARSRYEFAALSMATALDATPAPWSGPRRKPTATMWPTLVCDVVRPGDGP